MPEVIEDRTIFSLLEVSTSIQKTIADRYKSSYWIKAELIKVNYYQHSGHCYPELVEKRESKIIAQIRSNLWKDDYVKINTKFKKVLGEPLKDGIKILFLASISYSPQYGLSLRIIDIDPSFTLGDLEAEKLNTIKRLREEGIFNKNKTLPFPRLPKRVAIISVQSSKGYADFLKVFDAAKSSWGYKFFHLLFPSLLQGDNAVQTIIQQLKRIKKVRNHFDVAVIVRGGGGDIGMSCYNNYELAKEIAMFPIPLLTGIGHATNETVAEMVSYDNAITPTKLAELLIQKFHNFSVPVQQAQQKISVKAKQIIATEKMQFGSEVKLFRSRTQNLIQTYRSDLKEQVQTLTQASRFLFKNERDGLHTLNKNIGKGILHIRQESKDALIRTVNFLRKESLAHLKTSHSTIMQNANRLLRGAVVLTKSNSHHVSLSLKKLSDKIDQKLIQELNAITGIERNIDNMSPDNVLKRGYSITLLNGKAIRTSDQVKSGDVLNTTVFEGTIISTVNTQSNTDE